MNIKRSLFWVLMVAPALSFAQQKYTIIVKADLLNHAEKAFLNYQLSGKLITDSATLSAGQYIFSGVVAEPTLAHFFIRKGGASIKDKSIFNAAIWLEKGVSKVTLADPLSKPLITGGMLNSDYQRLEASKAPERAKMAAASKRFMEATEEQRKAPDFIKNHLQVMKAAMSESAVKDSLYITKHPNSYLSVYLVANTISSAPLSILEPKYRGLSKALQTSTPGLGLLKTINILKSREIGGAAADFTLNDTSNKPVSLSSFRGKYVLLDFWASWCVPCRKENPNVKAAYNQFKGKNFTVLSVSLDDGKDGEVKWLAAIEKDQLNWTQTRDINRAGGRVSDLYGVKTIPQNFLIDPNGKILAIGLRGSELQKKLAEFIH
ncbi:Thiol-disulfide oxidoreductase ResA [compost metagenome]